MEERDDGNETNREVQVSRMRTAHIEERLSALQSREAPRTTTPIATPAPTAEPASEPVLDEPPEPTPEPVPELAQVSKLPEEPLGGIEAAICAYPWECGIALRVAACESGPDYVAGYNGSGHAGTFQVSPIHAWRFAERGLNFWTDALVVEWNIDVAFEIWTERWWWAWSCF